MNIYRIADCQYINDLTGLGAAKYEGRWNSKEVYMLYTADTPALALLEAVVHIGKIPSTGYCIITIEIPDDSIEISPKEKLGDDWNKFPSPDYLKATGDKFIARGKSLAMAVPSAVMQEQNNYLINPAHPAFKKVKIINQRPFDMDERLLHSM